MTEIKKLAPTRNYWKDEEEKLLKQWADKAKCYQWLHNKSREIYQRKNAWFTIPVIIISTIVGTANFAQDRFTDDTRQYVVITIGSLSIIAGIITTIYQFLKISEINEGHRVSTLSWGKFHVNIESELSRHPLDRTLPSELIKISKNEFNRLQEISPFIPKKVLKEFNSKFNDRTYLVKPEIGNNINPLNLFDMDDKKREKMIEELNKGIIVKNKEIVQKKIDKDNKISKFRQSFFDLNNRQPTDEEIKKNLKYTDTEYNYSSDSDSTERSLQFPDNESENSITKYNSILRSRFTKHNSISDLKYNTSDFNISNKKNDNKNNNDNIVINIENIDNKNAGSENAGSENARSENAGSENAGSENAGSENAGSENAGSETNNSNTANIYDKKKSKKTLLTNTSAV